MAKSPFDLSFEDLVQVGQRASAQAVERARSAGVPVATLQLRDSASGWTSERVETLKKLWLEGLSVSQIANQIGGVTRNGVISKVHRLGLSGADTPPPPARTVFKAQRPRLVVAAQRSPKRHPDERPGAETVLILGTHMCKWPIGDPSLDSFTFCGRRPVEGGPYCAQHVQIAYNSRTPTSAAKGGGADSSPVIQIRSRRGG